MKIFLQKVALIFGYFKKKLQLCTRFRKGSKTNKMVAVVQLVRASDCGSECRGFESHLPPKYGDYSSVG